MRGIKPVLLAEDDKIDQEAVKRSFKQLRINNPLVIVSNGEEALGYLRDGKKEKPCVILLDVKMPRMGGIEFLKVIKADENFKRIPVVAFTTSDEEKDRLGSFNLGIAGYMLKSADYAKFVGVVRTIDLYWSLSELPPLMNEV